MRPIGVGLLGLGVVGGAVADVLLNKADMLAEQVGTSLVLRKVLVRDLSKKRNVAVDPRLLTLDAGQVITDPGTDIIVEVMGGERPALDYIRQAIEAGKPVVTANKEVMAKYGYRLLSLAQQHEVDLRYEASVGSGIPLISSFLQDLAANDISTVQAILNGTTNYVLTQMSQHGLDFPSALAQAQRLGYAESDPANDVEGIDSAYKLVILSSLAFHTPIRPRDVYREGISRLAAQDFRYAKEFGYAIKLLGIARRDGETVEVRVHPALTPLDSQLAKVDGVYNAIQVDGNLAGRLMFYGEGAGALPASSAILADVLTVARDLHHGLRSSPRVELNRKLAVKPMGDIRTRYYFRLVAADRPGVLAQVARVLGENAISISSVIQKETDPQAQTAVIVIMTHTADERAVQKALKEARGLGVVKEVSNFIRVQE
jgi:homoserine dehydrogenase